MKSIHNYRLFLKRLYRLLSITKLQNLKAIHNKEYNVITTFLVVINHKTTKFESNSQLNAIASYPKTRCYQSQNYKNWKQFTTAKHILNISGGLLSITKLQNLKAIHNASIHSVTRATVVINHKTTKFESNSQPVLPMFLRSTVVINHKTTKFESNSQRIFHKYFFGYSCYQSQNYKIWKQFTTPSISCQLWWWLLSITKLQNLKAIHNE